MRRISPRASTRVPMRVALSVARVAKGPCTVRTAAPAPLAGIALPVWLGPARKATRHIQASAQAVGRAGCPRHPYSHSESNCGPPSSIYPTLGGVSICSASYMAKKNNGLQT